MSGRLLALAGLATLVACNALNGAGDLTVAGACDGCEEGEGGIRVDGGGLADGAGPDPALDGSADATSGVDAAKEGPGGTLDPTFGVGGIVFVSPILDPNAVAVRADGRILAVGQDGNDLAALAFTSAGAIDTTFGVAGEVTKGIGSAAFGTSVAFDSQGRAVVGGTSLTVITGGTIRYACAVRIGASQVDTTFGNSGAFRGGNAGQDGRGVVVAQGDSVVLAVSEGGDHHFIRLLQSGVPDQSFGGSGAEGRATVSNVGGEPRGLVALADGFVSGGTGTVVGIGGQALAAAKVSLLGQPVSTFGSAARATSKVGPDNSEVGQAITAEAGGKILVAGDYDPNVANLKRVAVVTRFTTAGQVDTSYGTAGKVSIDLSEPLVGREMETTSTNLLLDSRGRTLAVGNIHDKPLVGGGDRFAGWAVRLRADGTLDPLFGTQGKLLVGIAPSRLVVRGAALQPDGKLVLVGVDTNGNKLFLARIITSTTL